MALWKIDEESSDRNFKEVEAYYKFYKLKKASSDLGLLSIHPSHLYHFSPI
jgi:hypothetical protein